MSQAVNAPADHQVAQILDWRKDRKVIGYALIVGIAIWTYGIDNGETAGFLAMQA